MSARAQVSLLLARARSAGDPPLPSGLRRPRRWIRSIACAAFRRHRFESPNQVVEHKTVAERGGFEPPIGFSLYTLSKRAPSATRPSLRLVLTMCSLALSTKKEQVAEGKGFEPPIPFPVFRFSRPAPSTTRPPFREAPGYRTCFVTINGLGRISLKMQG